MFLKNYSEPSRIEKIQISMKALVIGATGFIGRNITSELLRRGETVSLLVTSKDKIIETDELDVIEGDIRDPKTLNPKILKGVDVVFHAAGVAASFYEEEYMRTNFIGMRNVIEAIIESGYRPKFVYTSSLAAVGPTKDPNDVITEDTKPAPVDPYGKSKRKAEEYLYLMKNKISSVIIRTPVVYGHLDRTLFPLFRFFTRFAFPIIPDSVLSLIHIYDVVRAHILAAEEQTGSYEIFNISDGRRYTMEEIFDIINQVAMEQFSRRLRKIILPRKIILVMYRVLKLIPPHIGESMKIIAPDVLLRLAQRNWFCTYEKAEEHLGFKPLYTAKEGLRQSLLWYWKESILA